MSPKRRLILVIVGCLIVTGLLVWLLRPHAAPTITTGGDYMPLTTRVVFYNADNLYGAVTNTDIEGLRATINDYLESTYGKGAYRAQVVDDQLTLLATNPNGPPSFWFVLKIDGKPKTIRVNADLSGALAVFSLIPQSQ